jgi:hypothetical protein
MTPLPNFQTVEEAFLYCRDMDASLAEPDPRLHVMPLFREQMMIVVPRSAIQAGLLLNGIAAIALLMFMATLATAPADRLPSADLWLLKQALLVFGVGVFLAGATFVNAYVAQGALASGKTTGIGTLMRRLGLGLIAGSLLLFLVGLALAVSAI